MSAVTMWLRGMVGVTCVLLTTAALIWLGENAPCVLLAFGCVVLFVALPLMLGFAWQEHKR